MVISADRPLAGLRVIEGPGEVATRYAARLLAVLGATVVRLDQASDVAPLFGTWLDQGKRAAPNLDSAFASLTGNGPILVIAGQNPAAVLAMENALADRAELTVLLALTWFGARGPYADWTGNDPVMQALTGVAYSFGPREGPPVLPQGCAPQMVGGLVAFIAALAALMSPERTPVSIEVNVLEAALCFTETGAVAAAATGIKAQRLGVNRFVPTYPGAIYETADGYVGLTALTPAQWVSLCEMIGHPEMAGDERFRSTYLRLPRADEIDEFLVPALKLKTTDHWVREGDRLRIPTAPAPSPGEAPHMEHWKARGSFEPLSEAPGSPQGPTLPFRFDFQGRQAPRPAGGAAGPLAGMRVADFSMGWAGPLAARYLADLGADVLKIESDGRPDWWRGWEHVEAQDPPPREIQRNFMAVNRGKRGLDLNLVKPDGKAAAETILRHADLVIDNQGPNVMDRLGLGPADQRRFNPAVVSISMPPFGRTGPLAGLRAYGSTVEQACGMPFVNGQEDWPPCLQHVAYGDAVAGLYGAAAALIGFHARERLGGVEIDLCQVECLFQLGADAVIAEQAHGGRLPRTGSRRGSAAPCCVVRAAGDEAWLAVAVDGDWAWLGLCRALGRDDLAADASLSDLAGRKAREGELEVIIAAWAANHTPANAAAALQAHRVPAAPVLGGHQLWEDEHLAAAGFWAVQHRRYVGEHLTPHPPFRFDGARPALTHAAPVLGEHTDEVLAEFGLVRKG